MIDFTRAQVCYQGNIALDIHQPIHIAEGERVGIIGSNGAGKTTLIRALLGLVECRGDIRLGVEADRIAVHMQSNEYSSLTAVQYVMEAILGCSLAAHPTVQQLIDYFDFRACLKKRYKNLSGGQKQRLTLILILCTDSPLTIFDEVTSGLDFETRQRLMDKLTEWYREKTTTLLLVSHYYEELELLVDKLLLLEQGQVVAFGKKEELFHEYCGRAVFLLERNEKSEQLVRAWPRLEAPEHLTAIRCDDEVQEKELVELLFRQNLDYKRTTRDIEIMTMNAKKKWQEEQNREA
ncbi:MAG: ATP-binding cassette domain-containing protein [Ndongobacter sp.]|nr:ATP-binding cassette domain-containing protein [Ndongobacter sp.]